MSARKEVSFILYTQRNWSELSKRKFLILIEKIIGVDHSDPRIAEDAIISQKLKALVACVCVRVFEFENSWWF